MVSQRLAPYVAGAEQQAVGLARALQVRGVQVEIVTTAFRAGLAPRDRVNGIPVWRLRTAPRLAGGEVPTTGPGIEFIKALQIAGMAVWVTRHAREYDVVHGHCLSASSLGASIGAEARNVPFLLKPSLGGPDGELARLLRSRARRVLIGRLKNVNRFAVLDDSIADELAAIGVDRARMVAVPNGVDLDLFKPADRKFRAERRRAIGLPEGPLALYMGQLVARKGVEEVLAAWPKVLEREPQASLAVAGEGPLAAMVTAAAARDRARVLQLGVRNDVVDLLAAADLLVLPSRNESFGNVLIEALAAGRTGVAASLELDGRVGVYVEPDHPESISAGIIATLEQVHTDPGLGARCRAAAKPFDFSVVAARYEEMYREMLCGVR
jgi:glycosyltransferase involved in cell wall biosynthesis